MSRLVSAHEQAVPLAGGCCVIPQGTIQSSLTQGVLQPATQNSSGPSLAEMAGSKEGRRNVGTELGEKEHETFTVVLSLVNQDTLSTWPLQKKSILQNMFPCTEPGPPSSYYVHMSLLSFQSYFGKKNLKTKKTSPHIHSAQCQACS